MLTRSIACLARRTYCSQLPSTSSTPNPFDVPLDRIRNFCIIAHVDHGKSTLADRMLEVTGGNTVEQSQVLDRLPVERERGITVKAVTASMLYTQSQQSYLLNLIDTPGHVDFSYEVSRALAASDGALLLVDATQGVQAQTVANFWAAFEAGLDVIPVINKIDIASDENLRATKSQLTDVLDFNEEDFVFVSAKSGEHVEKVLLPTIVDRLPHPQSALEPDSLSLRALIFDSWFEHHVGAYAAVVVQQGMILTGSSVSSLYSSHSYPVKSLAIMTSDGLVSVDRLRTGQVGCVVAGMKTIADALVGDTFVDPDCTDQARSLTQTTFAHPTPMVYAGLFPVDGADYENVRRGIDQLELNDPAVVITTEISAALGPGWRIGFLGILHMEVFTQRLEQEYETAVLLTVPGVAYKVVLKPSAVKRYPALISTGRSDDDAERTLLVNTPDKYPSKDTDIEYSLEPMVKATIIIPIVSVGNVRKLVEGRRGVQLSYEAFGDDRLLLRYRLPLAEVIVDFSDNLKNLSSGFASLDFEDDGYDRVRLARLDIALNGRMQSELSTVLPYADAWTRGREIALKLKSELPQQQYPIAIQAKIGARVIAREDVKPVRKDVTAREKMYGGDETRKMKKLARQREGKAQMRDAAAAGGGVPVPRKVFINMLRR